MISHGEVCHLIVKGPHLISLQRPCGFFAAAAAAQWAERTKRNGTVAAAASRNAPLTSCGSLPVSTPYYGRVTHHQKAQNHVSDVGCLIGRRKKFSTRMKK
uniref:Uncharacterized protein n=1 Tax=Oryza sativa subsp. japonica TaxID=39947 RepID=Q7XHV5_ORYSJ|nr:hypothetical protein [Oryza sativa Japonica Group]